MTPIRQTIFVATHPKGRGNCMAAALASLPSDDGIEQIIRHQIIAPLTAPEIKLHEMGLLFPRRCQ